MSRAGEGSQLKSQTFLSDISGFETLAGAESPSSVPKTTLHGRLRGSGPKYPSALSTFCAWQAAGGVVLFFVAVVIVCLCVCVCV